MKTNNLRVDSPAIRMKLEISRDDYTLSKLVADHIKTYFNLDTSDVKYYMIKFRSVVYRSSGVALGEQEVSFLGRKFYAMFRSNSYIASVGFDGTGLNQWNKIKLNVSDPDNEKISDAIAYNEGVGSDWEVHSIWYAGTFGAPDDVTVVINYDIIPLDN